MKMLMPLASARRAAKTARAALRRSFFVPLLTGTPGMTRIKREFFLHVLNDVLDLGLLVVEREVCEVRVQTLASIQLKQVVVGNGGKTMKDNL